MGADEHKPMTISEIVTDWLRSHGYDGLYQDDGECACLITEPHPCGEGVGDCKAGVMGRCNPENCANGGGCKWHIVERGHPDQMTEEERKTFWARHNANADLADALNRLDEKEASKNADHQQG